VAVCLSVLWQAVSQDPLGKMGIRLSDDVAKQLWVRELSPAASGRSRAAVALYHKGGSPPVPPMPLPAACSKAGASGWTHTTRGYYEACGGAAGNVGTFSGLSVEQAQAACCANVQCAGFSFHDGSGYYKGNAACGKVGSATYEGYTKESQIPLPPPNIPADIELKFSDVPGCPAGVAVDVHDIYTGATSTGLHGSFVAKGVPLHGTAFLLIEWGA